MRNETRAVAYRAGCLFLLTGVLGSQVACNANTTIFANVNASGTVGLAGPSVQPLPCDRDKPAADPVMGTALHGRYAGHALPHGWDMLKSEAEVTAQIAKNEVDRGCFIRFYPNAMSVYEAIKNSSPPAPAPSTSFSTSTLVVMPSVLVVGIGQSKSLKFGSWAGSPDSPVADNGEPTTWTTSNSKVATVKGSGAGAVVVGVAPGKVTITAQYTHGEKHKATATVTVTSSSDSLPTQGTQPLPSVTSSPVWIPAPVPSEGTLPSPKPSPMPLTVLAGNGMPGYLDGVGTSVQFNWPGQIVVAPEGHLLVADWHNGAIRKLDRKGNVTTVATMTPFSATSKAVLGVAAGPGETAFAINGAELLTKTPLADPVKIFMFEVGGWGVAERNGDVYVTGQSNRIWKVPPTGSPQPIAGDGVVGQLDGDGLRSRFNQPRGLTFQPDGDLYVADHDNHSIRLVHIDTNGQATVRTVAQGGWGKAFQLPNQVAVAPDGTLLVACESGLVQIDPDGEVRPVLTSPAIREFIGGVAIDDDGTVFVSELTNNRVSFFKLRK